MYLFTYSPIYLFTLKGMEFNGTFFATIISFIIFVILMNKILYVPVLNIMEQRKKFIDENYKSASEIDSQASELTEEKDTMLTNAKVKAKAEYNEIINNFKTKSAEIISEAQEIAKNNLKNSKYELDNLSNEVKSNLKGSMSEFANDIVEKVIGYRSSNTGFNEEIIDKILWESK